MISFDQKSRIGTYRLYRSLMEISTLILEDVSMLNFREKDQKRVNDLVLIKESQKDWFVKDSNHRIKHLKDLSLADTQHYIGHWKIIHCDP